MIPSFLMPGIAEMKRGSRLLSLLNNDLTSLEKVECTSFFYKMGFDVIPRLAGKTFYW